MAKGRIVGALSFEALEGALASGLAALGPGPSRRVWVLVPTNLLALHLSRAVASSLGGVMGVRFLTLHAAAGELALRVLAERGGRPLPEGARELVFERSLGELDGGSCFAGFAEFPGSATTIARAIGLLKSCLWSPESLRRAAGRLAKRDAEAAGRLGELAGQWRRFEQFKREHRFFDDEDLLLEAARPAAGGPDAALLYGFYDLTPLQQALVRRIVDGAGCASAYLLWDEDAEGPAGGFEYAGATVEFLKEVLGAARVDCLGDVPGETDLLRLRRGLFAAGDAGATGAGSDSAGPPHCAADSSVSIVSCPGETAQVEEIAREMLRRFRDAGHAPVNAAVLARSTHELGAHLKGAFDRAGVQACMHEGLPLALTAAGRVAESLLRLADGNAERSRVIEVLSLAEIPWPEDLSPTALDRLSRLGGVVDGWDQWDSRLRLLADSLAGQAARAEVDSERAALMRDAQLCGVARGFLAEFFVKVRALRSLSTWPEAARVLAALIAEFTSPAQEGREAVIGLVRSVARLDATGLPAGLGGVRRLVGRRLRAAGLRVGRFQRVAVTVSSIMGSRGTTHEVVIVPDLVEKRFPLRLASDPLLGDRERAMLNGTAEAPGCGELPLQRRRSEEERYLLRIALGSARRAVVLLYPRIEEGTGEPRVFSRFIQEACEVLCGRAVEARQIDDGALGSLVARVCSSPAGPAEDSIDGWEYDLRVYAATDRRRGAAYAAAVSEFFARALELEGSRWSRAQYGAYEGKLRAPELLRAIKGKHARFDAPISATRLETYARCPFEYFLKYVLGVEEIEKPVEQIEISALDRGSLIHDLLAAAYGAKLKGRRMGEITEADITELVQFASHRLDDAGPALAARPRASWLAARQEAVELVGLLARAERTSNPDAIPRHFELSFGMGSGAEACRFDLGRGAGIALRGRIDRVDALPDGAVQVIDYKTGARARLRADSLAGGRQLQLPLYLLAASELLGAARGRAQYLHVPEQAFTPEFTLELLRERREDLRRAVGLILDGIASGDFFPDPFNDSRGRYYCEQHCPGRLACGQARAKLTAIKQGAPDLRRLWELRAIK